VPPLEIGFAVFEFHSGEFAPEDLDKEVAVAARRFQKARVNALGFALHEVEHGLDHPRGGENLPVVGDALFGLHQRHFTFPESNQVKAGLERSSLASANKRQTAAS